MPEVRARNKEWESGTVCESASESCCDMTILNSQKEKWNSARLGSHSPAFDLLNLLRSTFPVISIRPRVFRSSGSGCKHSRDQATISSRGWTMRRKGRLFISCNRGKYW